MLSLELETYINKAKKQYQDSRSRRHLNKLSDELQDVQKIMVQNIEDVLHRGENMSGMPLKPVMYECTPSISSD